jgi:WD40 repeat protein
MRSLWNFLLLPGLLVLAQAAPAADPPARLDATGDPLPVGARARLGTLRFRTTARIRDAELSPDGKLIAVAALDGSIRFLDAATGKQVRLLTVLINSYAQSLSFSPDGKVLAVVDRSRIQLWDTTTGRAGHALSVAQAEISSVVFSGDSKFVTACTKGRVQKKSLLVWETATGKVVASLNVLHNQVQRVALSADGKLLAVTGERQEVPDQPGKAEEARRTIQLWDVVKGQELHSLTVDRGTFSNVAFAPDGKTLAATWGNSTLIFWNVADGKEVRRCARRHGDYDSFAYSPDGKYLAAGSSNGVVQLWDAVTGQRLSQYEGPPNYVRASFSNDGKVLACGYIGKTVFIYDLLGRKLLTPALGHSDAVAGLAFRTSGKQLVSAGTDGFLCTWDPVTGREVSRLGLPGSLGNRDYIFLSPDGRHLLATEAHETQLCETATGKEVLSLEDSRWALTAAFSSDSSRVAVPTALDPTARTVAVRVYEIATGRQLRELVLNGEIFSLAFTPDGKAMAVELVPDRNSTLQLHVWDLTTGKERWQTKLADGRLRALAFAPDGKRLITSGADGVVKLWEGATGRELRGLTTPRAEEVTTVQFSPDGRLIAAAYLMTDKTSLLRVWEMASGTPRHEFAGHNDEVLTLCFAPDGKTLASGSVDTTVLLWDLTGRTGEALPKSKPSADVLDTLWETLNDVDGRAAFQAMRRLEAAPAEAVALLTKHVKAVEGKGSDADSITRLIAALDADDFELRQKAAKDLEALGKTAEEPLKKALAKKPSAEAKRAIEELLDKMKDKGGPPLELVRPLRAVEILENLGTPEARKVLESLAKGQAEAPLTVAAKEALERLARAAKDQTRAADHGGR